MCNLEILSELSDFKFFIITFTLLLISGFIIYLFMFLIPKKILVITMSSRGYGTSIYCKNNDPIMNAFIPKKYLYTFTVNDEPKVIEAEDFSIATKEIRSKGGKCLFVSTNDKRIIE